MTGKKEESRRLPAVVAALGAVLLGVAGAATWAIARVRAPAGPPAGPDQAAAAATKAASPPALGEPVVALADEPAPPPVGSAIRRPYFAALAAGDQRGLAVVRKALDAARGGNGSPDAAYLSRLESLERSYTERLERHSREANAR